MICISGIHVILTVTAPPPPTVQKNDNGYIKVIRGLSILGSRYDVNFVYQRSFEQVFSAEEPLTRDAPHALPLYDLLPFYAEGENGASAATFAIGEALNLQDVMNDGERANMLYVPYRATETKAPSMGVPVRAAGADPGSNVWYSFDIERQISRSVEHPNCDAWATFTISEDSENDLR
jgi:hypothetical protein